MSLLDALWHLLNFFAPVLGVGGLAALMAKGLWRRELRGVSLVRLALWAVVPGALVWVLSLVVFGREGTMLSFFALTLACTLGLWSVGFLPGLRKRP